MHISYKPLWHTLLERDMRKEDLRLAAGMTTNMIANMSKEGKHISMDTLARICETLNCEGQVPFPHPPRWLLLRGCRINRTDRRAEG